MSRAFANEAGDGGLEVLRGAWLRQHGVAAGAAGPLGLRRERRVAGHRKDGHVAQSCVALDPPRELEPVDPGNVQVGDDDVGPQFLRAFERLEPVVSLLDAEPRRPEPVGVQTSPVSVILNQ